LSGIGENFMDSSQADQQEFVGRQVEEQGLSEQRLDAFWSMSVAQRESILLSAIAEVHALHYERNTAYRRTVSARGIGPRINRNHLPRLLRPTSQTFKSYIEILGTPFPQDRPYDFLHWLAEQISVELPKERFACFRPRYRSLEALLQDIERIFKDLGLEVSTSSGTSGRSTIMLRDQSGIDGTVESFYLAFQRFLGMRADHRAIFIMPRETRIAMVRMASFSVARVGLSDDRIHFTIPFAAQPDQVRVRTGRTFRPGWGGKVEQRFLHPFMNWMNDRVVIPRSIHLTMDLLGQAEAAKEKVLLFGSWVHLHWVAQELSRAGRKLRLAAGSLIGTGGGMKERYPFTPAQIRGDLTRVIECSDGQSIPIRDVYGMAEGNWAAMQCHSGNYHVPPWIYAVVLDQDDNFMAGEDRTGLLAFFDPIGGGELFPSFFRTADQVRLINGAGGNDLTMTCPCGEVGAYISRDSIQRMDLLDEAGCGAQI
jgi:hypothetical protein